MKVNLNVIERRRKSADSIAHVCSLFQEIGCCDTTTAELTALLRFALGLKHNEKISLGLQTLVRKGGEANKALFLSWGESNSCLIII